MVTELELLDGVTTTKQNLSGEDIDSDDNVRIFRSNLRLWNKITRLKVVGDTDDSAVILPFNILLEPFYSEDDVDSSYTTGSYNSSNHYYELYSDLLGNFKTIQSKVISYRNNHKLKSVTMTVDSEYVDGTSGINGIDLILIFGTYSGEEIIVHVNNGKPVYTQDYTGADLNADLNTTLYGSLNNYNETTSTFLYQHQLKYRIVRNSQTKVIVKKVVLVLNWDF